MMRLLTVAVLALAVSCLALGQVPSSERGAPTSEPTSEPTTQPDLTPITAEHSVVKRDVPYVQDGHKQQALDLYVPAGARKAPVLVFIHGGEWTKGDKRDVANKPRFFNEQGVIFVSANYRLSGTAQHPAQVNDVAAAVRWVRDHVAEYGGDPQRIVLMGHSAGCHLVTLAGLDPRPLQTVGMKPADLAGVVSWSGGAFDLVDKVKSGGMYADYIRKTFGPDEATWRDASPLVHIGDAKPMPRFLFASAEKGNPASRALSERMAQLINSAGGNAKTVDLDGKSHSAANNDIGRPGDATGDILLRFIHDVERPRS